nr:hypothetical protein [Oscillospiraceae bacterium]
KGGARQIPNGDTYTWTTDGEDVVGESADDPTEMVTYYGGTTGAKLTAISGLSEANFIAYGGNGAGAAVGIDRDDEDYEHINGGEDQTTSWDVEVD